MQKGSYILHGGVQFCGVGCEGTLTCHLSEKALLEDWPNRLKRDLPTPDSWQIDAHLTELPVERPHVRARRSLVKMYII